MNLYPHQKQAVDAFRPKWGLFFEMRCGKSLTAILLAKKANTKALVICPKGIKTNWIIEIEKFAGNADVITKETFRRDHQSLPKYNAIIVDECHWFGNPKSQLAKSLATYITRHNPSYIWLLSGTPYLSSPWGIWALGRLLGKTGGIWNYIPFRNQFFFPMKMGMRIIWQPKPNKIKELADLTKTIGSVVKTTDVIDFPDEVNEIEYLSLTPQQKKAITVVKENEILVLPRMTREHQICGGTLKDNPYLKETEFATDKIERTLAFIAEHKKAIVVVRYNDEIDYICKHLSEKVYIINGDVNNRNEVITDFEKADQAILIVNSACCEGWQSITCDAMLFYSMDFSLKNYLQIKARIKIPAYPKKLYYKFLLCKDTIDEDVYNSVVIEKMEFMKWLQMKNML